MYRVAAPVEQVVDFIVFLSNLKSLNRMKPSTPPSIVNATSQQITTIFQLQRKYFDDGHSRSFEFRLQALRNLLKAVREHKDEIVEAMYHDYRKPSLEAYMGDVAVVIEDLKLAIKQLKEWMEPQTIASPVTIQPSSGRIVYEPKGVVAIFAPWNYPFNLAITPLIGAIAAGNCIMLKPAHETPHTALVLEKLITSVFDQEHVAVIQGDGRETGPAMLQECIFNHIFFTGSAKTGRWVMEQAAKTLTPVTLELGGKSPAIVDATAKLDIAAKRIAWAKFFNAGQTCLSTDYALVHEDVYDAFVQKMQERIHEFYGDDPAVSPHFSRIVNEERATRIASYLHQGKILAGGQSDITDRYIAPSILLVTDLDAPVMKEEIFGPVLPILKWKDKSEVVDIVRKNRYPLACYIFSEDQTNIDYFIGKIEFGGGCINDAIIHYANPSFPFGGVMTSGSGRYHGKHTFETFSHAKPILRSLSWVETHVWFPPYSSWKSKIIKALVK